LKALVNGTILCPVNGQIENATVLFEKGKILEVGADVDVPDSADVVDVKGKYILPGFVEAHAHQGLFDGSIGWAGADGNEATDPVTPEVRGIDSFNPDEPSIAEVPKGGVTCVNTGPGSANVVSGEAFVFKPTGDAVVDDMVIMAPSGLKIATGENPKGAHGKQHDRMPSTRMGVAALLRKTFTEARNYMDEWKAYGEKRKEAKEKGEALPKPPNRDLGKETLVKVLKREIPVHAHAHRADDIATVVRVAKEFNLRVMIIHCTEGHKIADFLAENDVPAVVGPTMFWVSKPETRERGFETAVKLNEARVKVALQTDSLTPMNFFPLLPMHVIKKGMSREDALRCVTINPAEMLGLENRVGSLEVGKDADIVVWSGPPFEFYSEVERVFIDGEEMDLSDE